MAIVADTSNVFRDDKLVIIKAASSSVGSTIPEAPSSDLGFARPEAALLPTPGVSPSTAILHLGE